MWIVGKPGLAKAVGIHDVDLGEAARKRPGGVNKGNPSAVRR